MSSYSEDDAFEAAAAPARGSLTQRAMAGMRSTAYLDDLNPAQREAVETLDGPVLMLAGAGTGKTKALMARVAHLMTTGRARPDQILCVTFTNKAAKEMKGRLAVTPFDIKAPIPWMGTFHAICVKLLRKHAELISVTPLSGEAVQRPLPPIEPGYFVSPRVRPHPNAVLDDIGVREYEEPRPGGRLSPAEEVTPTALHLKSNFTILDTDDQIRLLKQVIAAANIDEKRWPARQLAGLIDHWKNRCWTPGKVPKSESAAFNSRGTELYEQYQRRLLELNAVDFGDLIVHMVTIFQAHPDVLEQYQRWFKYILVDEYQDTNVAQYMWLRLLAGGHKNICCVGDDDQSIYGWRGAEVGNILRFEKDFPGAKVVRLEQNYRSTPHILAAASAVIAGNENRLGKTLWTEAEEGEKIRLIGHWDGDEEARWIGDEIEALQGGTRTLRRFSADEMAILVRASHQMRAFEDRFLTIGLPYRVIGGPRFYERLEIRDAMAYFRLVTSPSDDLAFERIVNQPKRGLGDKAQQKIQMAARANGTSLLDGARILLQDKGLTGKGAAQLSLFIDQIDRWHEVARLHTTAATLADEDDVVMDDDRPQAPFSHVELAEQILDESGYTEMWQNDKNPDSPGRLENLKELVKALDNFDNLQGFLEHVALIMDNERNDDAEPKVSIMTLHAAKGLEFPVVFLPGWEDGLFPSQRSMDESGLKGLEEERRLAYVGITRAEELCTISFAGNRRVFGQWQSQLPSRFIDELSEEDVEVLTPPGLYGGGYGAASGGSVQSGIETRMAEANVYNSPGWRRMQARAGERPVSQPRESRSPVIDMTAASSHTVGERVFHQKFGYGEILGVEGDKLEIAFDKAGVKKVVAKFVTNPDDVPF